MESEAGAPKRPIFITGRFRSGTTVLWQILRRIPSTRTFFEPLHDNLLAHIAADAPPDPSHVGVTDYFAEYAGREAVLALHDPSFGTERLCLARGEEHGRLERYLRALVGSCGEARPVLKCVRADFRLPWIRRILPDATIVSIRRDPRDVWASMLAHTPPERRLDPWLNTGYDLSICAAALLPSLPAVAARSFGSSYETAYLLSRVSEAVARRYADLVIDYAGDLQADTAGTLARLLEVTGLSGVAPSSLAAHVVPREGGHWSVYAESVPFAEIERHGDELLRRSGLLEAIATDALDEGRWPQAGSIETPVELLTHLGREISRHREVFLDERTRHQRAAREFSDQSAQVAARWEEGTAYAHSLERAIEALRQDAEREIQARDQDREALRRHAGALAAEVEGLRAALDEARRLRDSGRRGLRIAVFTIAARNYLAFARALFSSLAVHHPDFDRYLILSDRIDGAFDPGAEDFEVVEAEALGIDELADMAFRYDVTEFSTAIKPAAFRHLMDGDRYDAVVYLDPDVYVVSPMAELLDRLAGGAEAVLTPHICAPVEDGQKPDDHSMLQSGVYNLGFLTLAAGEETQRFLAWWQRRLVRDCRVDLAEGLFVDQKWADLLPGFVERTEVLRHPGYNLAYWNLVHRKVSRDGERWLTNELPLRFVHFSGIDADDPGVFSRHQRRFSAASIGELGELVHEYRRLLERMGWRETRGLAYAYGNASGRAIPEIVRRLYREDLCPGGHARGGDPLADVLRLGNQADPRIPAPEGLLVTRLMTKVWEQRPDLAAAFDLQTAAGRRGFVEWFLHSAAAELSLDARFTEEVERRYRAVLGAGLAQGPGPGSRTPAARSLSQRAAMQMLAHSHRFKRLYLRVPIPVRRRVKTALLRTAYRPASFDAERGHAAPRPAEALPVGARLIGYPRAELGMGEHVRLTAVALASVGYPFALYDFSANVVARQQDDRFVGWLDNDSVFNVNLFHINADQMGVVRDSLGESFFRGRYNVGYWAWELSRFPLEWKPALEMVDEVWAPSRFVEQSIAGTSDRPVVWMPIAVRVEPPGSVDRRHFGLPEDRFVFLFSFDFSSFATRKNPRAVIEAFRRAFGRERRDVLLVIKSMGQDWHQAELESLRDEVADDPRMRLLDGVLAPREIAGLTNSCDCYVSLHRSEGFGRGMAEAMALGKPVIATNYSGNTDFMDAETSCLVDYELVPVGEGEYPHHAGQVWADPDIEHAAWYMRRLVADPPAARRLGARARQHIEQGWGPATVGARIRERLRALGLG